MFNANFNSISAIIPFKIVNESHQSNMYLSF
jgi:hypothetical protein